ncbi:MAG: Hsp20 family protein [Bdellovibrionales bacterium]|nr:Hsp20 family protein [Bdellovibrionales bacterium]
MSTLKVISISLVGALIGGLITFAALTKDNRNQFSRSEKRYDESIEAIKSKDERDLFDRIFKQQKQMGKHFDSFFDDDFFNQDDPFESMKQFREHMMKETKKFGTESASPFDYWFEEKFGGGSINDISKREDDQFVYYDIVIDDLQSTTLDTHVENGYVTITGKIEKKSENDDKNGASQSIFSSTFSRSLPLPSNVDEKKMQMIPEENKVILKFPKVHV